MKPEQKKPWFTAKVGNVRVPVYRYADRDRYCVAWKVDASTPRKREVFTSSADAKYRAHEVARAIANSRADVVTLTSADRDAYRAAVLALAPMGVPLQAAVEEYVAARKEIGAYTLMEAAEFFARERVDKMITPPARNILQELLAKLEDDRRSDAHKRGVKRDVGAFVEVFPDIEQVTEEGVREYLRGLRVKSGKKQGEAVSARRRDNVRDAIVMFLRFARVKGYIPDKRTVAEEIPKIAEGGEVSTLNPNQVMLMLDYFATQEPDWLPWAATALFAGLRTSEIFRLEWSAFAWEMDTIAIRRSVARKVRVSRQAPLLPVLAAWLSPWRQAQGFLLQIPGERTMKNLENAQRRMLRRFRESEAWQRIGLTDWPRNVLRHSFGSHRLAVLKSYDAVSIEMGNSPAQVREHYNDPKPEKTGEQYFQMFPPKGFKNIIPFAKTS